MVCGWFGWFVDSLDGLLIVSSFTANVKRTDRITFYLTFWLRKYHLFFCFKKIRIHNIFACRKDGKYDFS